MSIGFGDLINGSKIIPVLAFYIRAVYFSVALEARQREKGADS